MVVRPFGHLAQQENMLLQSVCYRFFLCFFVVCCYRSLRDLRLEACVLIRECRAFPGECFSLPPIVKVGVTPPSKTTLRNWQLAVDALHQESFEALKEVCESDEAEVDGPAVTLTYLTRKEFAEFPALQQRFCIHLVSRQAGGYRGVVVRTESPAVPTPFSPSTC